MRSEVDRGGADARRLLGQLGERLAAEHLVRQGFEIVERNYRTRWGELDIVAFNGRTLAFCEVKARRLAAGGGSPFDSIRVPKRAQVRRMAGSWLHDRPEHPYAEVLRFDAIGVTFDAGGRLVSIDHVAGAW